MKLNIHDLFLTLLVVILAGFFFVLVQLESSNTTQPTTVVVKLQTKVSQEEEKEEAKTITSSSEVTQGDSREEKIEHQEIKIVSEHGRIFLTGGWPVEECDIKCFVDTEPSTSRKIHPRDAHGVFHEDWKSAFLEGTTHQVIDIVVNYHLPSDDIVRIHSKQLNFEGKSFIHLPITYATRKYNEFFEPPLPFKEKIQKVLGSIYMSNCNADTNRKHIIETLANHFEIHSYGRCLRNANETDIGCSGKLCTIRKYKFYFAFENSIDDSYVTEKLFEALDAGTVPVYLGAKNVDQFDPGKLMGGPNDTAIIKVSDFETLDDLARYLIEVANDEAKYNKYLEWKTRKPTAAWKQICDWSIDFPITTCRICKAVAKVHAKKLKALEAL